MSICGVCGNEQESGVRICRFCGAEQQPEDTGGEGIFHKTINLERGRPFVEAAMKRLTGEIKAAKIEQVKVMTVIHGYGSSGKGGAIKVECRKCLDYFCSVGEIKEYIPGEEFSGRSRRVRSLLRRLPRLASNQNLDRRNPGVTLIVMQ